MIGTFLIFWGINIANSQATITSTGINTDWASDDTWDLGRPPNANDSVVINSAVEVGSGVIANADAINIISGGFLNMFSGDGVVNFRYLVNSGNLQMFSQTARISGESVLNIGSMTTFGTIELAGDLVNENFFSAVAGEIQIGGDFRNTSPNLNISSIPVTFNGTTLQQIFGTIHFSDIEVMPGANVALANGADISLKNRLLIGDGSTFNTGSANFVLLSSSDGPTNNASIGPIPSNATFTGNVTVRRFMSAEGRIYRYLSSPVQAATIADWQDNFSITGTFSGASTSEPGGTGCDPAITIQPTSPSLYVYKASTGYLKYPTTNQTAKLTPGVGYAAFIRKCSGSVTVDVTGEINQGDVDFLEIDYNNTTGDGWNLIGNPYPSTIQWDLQSAGWTSNGLVAESIAIRDNGAGVYRYNGLWSGDEADGVAFDGLIATGQGFWVRTMADGAELTIHEQAKSTGGTFYRDRPEDEIILSLNNGTITDLASYRIRPDAQTGLDRYDAPKLNNYQDLVGEVFDLATLSPDEAAKAMAINAVPSIGGCEVTVNVLTKDMANGAYTFSLKASGLMTGYRWVLQDQFLEKEIELTPDTEYEFNVSDELSGANDRFTLVGTKQIDPVVIAISEDNEHTLVSSYGKGNQWFFNGTLIPGATTQSITATETGLYEVEVTTKDGCVSRTSREMIVLGAEEDANNGYELYPNPVEDRLTIVLPHAGNATGTVMSTFGKTLGNLRFEMSDGRKMAVYDFSGQPAGLYVVKIRQGNQTHHYKILKQ